MRSCVYARARARARVCDPESRLEFIRDRALLFPSLSLSLCPKLAYAYEQETRNNVDAGLSEGEVGEGGREGGGGRKARRGGAARARSRDDRERLTRGETRDRRTGKERRDGRRGGVDGPPPSPAELAVNRGH